MSKRKLKAYKKKSKTQTPEYKAYANAIQRCKNPNDPNYYRYGARGISVDSSFQELFADIGTRPSDKHTLDRIDNDGNYVRGNVRWATRAVQRENRHDSGPHMASCHPDRLNKALGLCAKCYTIAHGRILVNRGAYRTEKYRKMRAAYRESHRELINEIAKRCRDKKKAALLSSSPTGS